MSNEGSNNHNSFSLKIDGVIQVWLIY